MQERYLNVIGQNKNNQAVVLDSQPQTQIMRQVIGQEQKKNPVTVLGAKDLTTDSASIHTRSYSQFNPSCVNFKVMDSIELNQLPRKDMPKEIHTQRDYDSSGGMTENGTDKPIAVSTSNASNNHVKTQDALKKFLDNKFEGLSHPGAIDYKKIKGVQTTKNAHQTIDYREKLYQSH